MPHPIEFCYGSPLHCWSHNEDEPAGPSYRWCFECGHNFATAEELLKANNDLITVMNNSPWTDYVIPLDSDPEKVFCCPHCAHDF